MAGNSKSHPITEMTTCWRFSVSGRVQGVYFRASTRDEALRLGLTGLARNERDGTVTVFACGDAKAVRQLHEWLQHGPPAARVDDVTASVAGERAFQDFLIG